jgi:hypothetical protein
MQLTKLEKAYIAGFLDGDGCVMFQLVRRKDYIYGYQVRASIVFYQKDKHVGHLQWLKKKLVYGYVRIRKDRMAEYAIVGIQPVMETLSELKPYVRLKKKHVFLAEKIAKQLPRYQRLNKQLLLKVSQLIDQYTQLNYSKRRTNTTATLQAFFAGKIPRND